MKQSSTFPLLILISFALLLGCVSSVNRPDKKEHTKTKIQVAILLDTSGSMDGLIGQAKSRLWNIVNTLTTLRFEGEAPQIEIALYEYGRYTIKDENYIRQITLLTSDLDLISEELFSLTTGGSEEYCGAVILDAVKALDWGNNESDMKLIYIAGNEEFDQGSISYREAISAAREKNIYINTIHCGDERTGIEDLWKDAATRGKGAFFNINSDARIRHISSPYDEKINECNEKLNKTYIGYGNLGFSKKANQIAQDENAKMVSEENYTERAVSKSKEIYKNSSWDLVDKVKEDKNALSKIKEEELPDELKNKSKDEIAKVVKEKEDQRKEIQKEITELAKKRQEYIDQKAKENGADDDLGKAINSSIIRFAKEQGYSVVAD